MRESAGSIDVLLSFIMGQSVLVPIHPVVARNGLYFCIEAYSTSVILWFLADIVHTISLAQAEGAGR